MFPFMNEASTLQRWFETPSQNGHWLEGPLRLKDVERLWKRKYIVIMIIGSPIQMGTIGILKLFIHMEIQNMCNN